MFLAIDGIDGSGKTTVARLLGKKLEDSLVVRAPHGPARVILLNNEEPFEPDAMPWLFIADMIHTAKSVILPAIAEGRHVVCDRYLASTWTYQIDTADHLSGRQKQTLLDAIKLWVPVPELTVILDVSPEVAAKRREARGEALTRFEDADDLKWQRRRMAYLEYARSGLQQDKHILFLYTDMLTPEQITEFIYKEVIERCRY